MSGSKSITGIVLTGNQVANDKPAGTAVGSVQVTMSDGTAFSGTLTLSGTYASLFTIEQTRDPYAISSISLDNSSLGANPPVGTKVGTITVSMSDQSVFAGTLSVNDTAHFRISGSDLVTSASLTNGANYSITITATDIGSTNDTLSANFQLSVQAAGQVPGPLTSIASPLQTTTTMEVAW